MMMNKNIILIILIIFSSLAIAREERNIGRSARGLLMGDAYTAIADDESTLYYNPATLGRHKGFSFWPINPTIQVPNILKDPDRFSDVGTDPADFADVALNFPIHIGTATTPAFKMGKFGLTAIVNSETNLNLVNTIDPMLDIDHRYDKGFIAGYGFPLSGSEGSGLSAGLSVKYLQREGLFGSYNLISTTMLDALNEGEFDKILEALGQVKGSGWGVDFGLDYINKAGATTFTMGLAVLDPYTQLQTESNENDLEVQTQPMRINFGSAVNLDVGGGFDLTVSADIRNLESQMEFMKRVRLGFDIGFSPLVSIMAGYNSGLYSYGIKANLAILEVVFGFYDVDIGEKLGQQTSNRALIYFSLFDFTFDG